MNIKSLTLAVILLANLSGFIVTEQGGNGTIVNRNGKNAELAQWTPYQVIDLINNQRVAYGLPALVVDPILMQTAQSTADIMAANRMHGHIGDVRGRVQAAGYGAGDIPWATENFVVVPDGGEDAIASAWADASHQIPVVNPNYKHVGAGVAPVDGMVYYVLHAAYTSNGIYEPGSSSYSAPSTSSSASSSDSSNNDSSTASSTQAASQFIYAVQTVTPSSDGKLVHTVQYGQSMWSIAIAYNTHIADIAELNGLDEKNPVIWAGQELKIPFDSSLVTPIVDNDTQVEEKTKVQPSNTPIVTLTPVLKSLSVTATSEPVTEHAISNEHINSSIFGLVIAGIVLIVIGMMAARSNT